MTTTLVKDSIVGDAWITQTSQNVPVQKVLDPETGNETGDLLTGPVRLAFDTLFDLPPATSEVPNPKYASALLFTPFTDMTLFKDAFNKICQKDFPEYYNETTGQYHGIHSPFRYQDEKLKFAGFTPGCFFMSCSSKFKPPVVDVHKNPIIDRSKVYAGVWAICAVNPYSYKSPKKKGVGFGLQSVMIIGDDSKFAGSAPDPNVTFAATKGAIQAPAVSAVQVGGAAPNPVMPRPPAGGTHAAPAPQGVRYTMPGQAVPTNNDSPPSGPVQSQDNDISSLL